ncbi:MAG: GDP-mannose 4,6-dehydratase, partial [Patescibacteria group bacterium]
QRIINRVDPFAIYGPDETRTFCYITDAVRAIKMLMDSTATDAHPIETVHIGNTDEITMRELAEKMFAITGWKPQKLEMRASPAGSVKRRLADISKLQNITGWKPEINLNQGLKLTYDWYTANPKK